MSIVKTSPTRSTGDITQYFTGIILALGWHHLASKPAEELAKDILKMIEDDHTPSDPSVGGGERRPDRAYRLISLLKLQDVDMRVTVKNYVIVAKGRLLSDYQLFVNCYRHARGYD